MEQQNCGKEEMPRRTWKGKSLHTSKGKWRKTGFTPEMKIITRTYKEKKDHEQREVSRPKTWVESTNAKKTQLAKTQEKFIKLEVVKSPESSHQVQMEFTSKLPCL